MTGLAPREAAVLEVLRAAGGRVVSRAELAHGAGLVGLSPRRVDGVLVRLRRALPDGALVTVRGRGWALMCTKSERAGNAGAPVRKPPVLSVSGTPTATPEDP